MGGGPLLPRLAECRRAAFPLLVVSGTLRRAISKCLSTRGSSFSWMGTVGSLWMWCQLVVPNRMAVAKPARNSLWKCEKSSMSEDKVGLLLPYLLRSEEKNHAFWINNKYCKLALIVNLIGNQIKATLVGLANSEKDWKFQWWMNNAHYSLLHNRSLRIAVLEQCQNGSSRWVVREYGPTRDELSLCEWLDCTMNVSEHFPSNLFFPYFWHFLDHHHFVVVPFAFGIWGRDRKSKFVNLGTMQIQQHFLAQYHHCLVMRK